MKIKYLTGSNDTIKLDHQNMILITMKLQLKSSAYPSMWISSKAELVISICHITNNKGSQLAD